jgi:hypothetical protein
MLFEKIIPARFQVLTAASMKFRVFWDVAPCNQVDADNIYWLHDSTSQKTLNEIIPVYTDKSYESYKYKMQS